MDLKPFNFLEEDCFSVATDAVVGEPFNLSKIPREVFRLATAIPPSSAPAFPGCGPARDVKPNVLRLSKRPSKSLKSSYSLKLPEPMLGRGRVSSPKGYTALRIPLPLGREGETFVDFVVEGAVYPIPSYASVGGLPIIQAWIFHSAAWAVLRMLLGTYLSHL